MWMWTNVLIFTYHVDVQHSYDSLMHYIYFIESRVGVSFGDL